MELSSSVSSLASAHPLSRLYAHSLQQTDGAASFAFLKNGLSEADVIIDGDSLLTMMTRGNFEDRQIRCYRNGEMVNADVYLAKKFNNSRRDSRKVSPARASELLSAGCTFVLDSLDLFDDRLEIAVRALQWQSGERCKVNGYIATGPTFGSGGLHWDDHDIIVVQVEGTKLWEIREPTFEFPVNHDVPFEVQPPDEVLWQGDLEAGDVLYIPRGYYHRVWRESDGHSVHLTFSITHRTGLDYLRWLASEAGVDRSARQDLVDNATTGSQLHELLTKKAHEVSIGDYLDMERSMAPSDAIVYAPPIHHNLEWLVCATPFAPQVTRMVGGAREVKALGDWTVFDADDASLLEDVLRGVPVSLSALRDQHGAEDADRVCETLLRARLLSPCGPELRRRFHDVMGRSRRLHE